MSLSVYIEPYAEPLSLTEAKNHLRIISTDTTDDILITNLIKAARQSCELFQNRAYVAQTFKLILDDFGGATEIVIPRPPLIGVDSVQYIDTSGVTRTLATTVYDTDTYSQPARIVLAYAQSWPSIRGDIKSVIITYKAGYVAPVTVDVDTDIFTISGRTFSNGDIVRFTTSGGTLPTGISADTSYYVINVSSNTFQISATSGSSIPIVISAAGSATIFIGDMPANVLAAMKLLIAHWYENRQPVVEGHIIEELTMIVPYLLLPDKVQFV